MFSTNTPFHTPCEANLAIHLSDTDLLELFIIWICMESLCNSIPYRHNMENREILCTTINKEKGLKAISKFYS
jgi:hypothetical protein